MMKTLISHVRRSSLAFSVVLLLAFAATMAGAQTADSKPPSTKLPISSVRQNFLINDQSALQTDPSSPTSIGSSLALFPGIYNRAGSNNVFLGTGAGSSNTTGSNNSFIGVNAGQKNVAGPNNVFIGFEAGKTQVSGHYNTLLGTNAQVLLDNLSYATAIGADATTGGSNSITLGRSTGKDGVRIPGLLLLYKLGTTGGTSLCLNSFQQVSFCSSSLRYKTNIASFSPGLNLLQKLRPIRFEWRDGGTRDVGFGAEDVAAIEPLLVTYNDKGEVEGVKYDRLTTVLVNAVKEQQAQIDSLKKLLCGQHPDAEVCK